MRKFCDHDCSTNINFWKGLYFKKVRPLKWHVIMQSKPKVSRSNFFTTSSFTLYDFQFKRVKKKKKKNEHRIFTVKTIGK